MCFINYFLSESVFLLFQKFKNSLTRGCEFMTLIITKALDRSSSCEVDGLIVNQESLEICGT
jgi:hypothetical protein